jgi:hypothetical protein
MQLDRTILGEGKPGICSASEWNKFARAVNTAWNSRAAGGIKLVKGEPWVFYKTATSDPPNSGPANGPIYRVFVDRGDGWGYGSTDAPRAIYLAGNFTSYGGADAPYAARLYKGGAGDTRFSNRFAVLNQFSGWLNMITQTPDGRGIVIGGSVDRTRNGSGGYGAWILDYDTDDLSIRCAINEIPSHGIASGGLADIKCYGNNIVAINTIEIASYDLTTGVLTSGLSAPNVHNLAGIGSDFLVSGRRVTTLELTSPSALHKINSSLVQDSVWALNGGSGSGGDVFSLAPTQKQNFTNVGTGDLVWACVTNEYTGTSFDWNEDHYYTSASCALIRLKSSGQFTNTVDNKLAITRDASVLGHSPRAELYCVDPDDTLWFGGGVSLVESNVQIVNVLPQRLYNYQPQTQNVTYFDGFNGPVFDCQWFRKTNAGLDQYIVVGEFTQYRGEDVPYMVFIDANGNRLADLEWP